MREECGVVEPIPAECKKTVEDLKAIFANCSKQQVYHMLKQCDMDPNLAAQMLLSQGGCLQLSPKNCSTTLNDDTSEAMSLAAANLQQISSLKDVPVVPLNAVVIPNHLKVSDAACSHLRFGTFRRTCFASDPLKSCSKANPVATSGSSIQHLETRQAEQLGDNHRISMWDANREALKVAAYNPRSLEFLKGDDFEATQEQRSSFPSSIPDYDSINSQQPNFSHAKQQRGNLFPVASGMVPKSSNFSVTRPTAQTLHDTRIVARPALPHNLMVHPYSQPSLPQYDITSGYGGFGQSFPWSPSSIPASNTIGYDDVLSSQLMDTNNYMAVRQTLQHQDFDPSCSGVTGHRQNQQQIQQFWVPEHQDFDLSRIGITGNQQNQQHLQQFRAQECRDFDISRSGITGHRQSQQQLQQFRVPEHRDYNASCTGITRELLLQSRTDDPFCGSQHFPCIQSHPSGKTSNDKFI